MYNLLVSNLLSEPSDGPLEISESRFLEYTNETITMQLKSLSKEAIAAMKSWPCLVMREGRGEEVAFVTEIVSLKAGSTELVVGLSKLQTQLPILNADIWRMRDRLDIGQFEFSRHHWAIKEQELIQILQEANFKFVTGEVSRFKRLPLPAPSRTQLLEARNFLSSWGHTEIDDFLLEAGVPELNAGRQLGSRRDRANEILNFIFKNPSVNTVENSLFSVFFRIRALRIENESEETTETQPIQQAPLVNVDQPQADSEMRRSSNRVFIVHGRNESARISVVEFLKQIGMEPIVLHEQANMGRHLLTKFIEEAELVTFAVILMTDDDIGGMDRDDMRPRARQNVILELGYFLSHLGQSNVCALITPGLETPSDFDGIAYIKMDEGRHWQAELERELRAAALPVGQK